jgi:hypothetical protein
LWGGTALVQSCGKMTWIFMDFLMSEISKL